MTVDMAPTIWLAHISSVWFIHTFIVNVTGTVSLICSFPGRLLFFFS